MNDIFTPTLKSLCTENSLNISCRFSAVVSTARTVFEVALSSKEVNHGCYDIPYITTRPPN